jgi:alkylated DNA repair dioxygenase AlkB
MTEQLDFFATQRALPEGFRYQRDLITPEAERALLTAVRDLPFKAFEFHGHLGKRRTVSFGWAYDFSSEALAPADAMPAFLLHLRETAAEFAALSPGNLRHVLVTEYGANAGIGWHRDKSAFGQVIGISLLSPCRFRLRRQVAGKWERINLDLEPRSAYLLDGPARAEWEHSIPPVDAPRYSVTFRTIQAD